MKSLKTTNSLLLIIALPVVFYILKTLSFIFVPLVFSMFIALFYLPVMRYLTRKGLPKLASVAIVILMFLVGLKVGVELIKLSSREIMATDQIFLAKAEKKVNELLVYGNQYFGLEKTTDLSSLKSLINPGALLSKSGGTLSSISKFLTASLMTVFFTVLWLSGSIDVQQLLNDTILKKKHTSVKTFRKIEKDLVKFIKVKVFVSALTGIATGLFCYMFDVSFPIFWGLFAFFINFVQMVGSFIAVICCAIFATVELEFGTTLYLFVFSISMVQVVIGAILEPILMGKSFAINTIAILIMLMFWGFIWGISGLIMAIPITVFIKIILDNFPQFRVLSKLLKG